MTRISFSVPGPPRQKERPRSIPGQPRPYTPRQTVLAERAMLAAFRAKYPTHSPFTGPVKLTVVAVFEMPKSWPKRMHDATGTIYHVSTPDLDNLVKLCDALNGYAYADDGQVAEIVARKRYGSPPRTDIFVETLDQPDIPATPGQVRLEARCAAGSGQVATKPARANQTKSKKRSPRLQAAIDAALARETGKLL